MILLVLPDIPLEDHLLAQAAGGSQDALRQIYEGYFSPVYGFIRLRVEDAQAAEDLASEVFVKMVEAFQGRNAPHHSLRGWLFRVARNVLHDHYGKRQRYTETALEDWLPETGDSTMEAALIRKLDVETTRAAIRSLPIDQQEVIVLRFGQMLNLQETADVMGKSITAIKSLQFRAVNALRRTLDQMRTETSHG